uniref:Uncharacterized protein n=1 Tax=Glossina austeni TaxID=7395 RepID=A0A1A9UZX2_GLOAU
MQDSAHCEESPTIPKVPKVETGYWWLSSSSYTILHMIVSMVASISNYRVIENRRDLALPRRVLEIRNCLPERLSKFFMNDSYEFFLRVKIRMPRLAGDGIPD